MLGFDVKRDGVKFMVHQKDREYSLGLTFFDVLEDIGDRRIGIRRPHSPTVMSREGSTFIVSPNGITTKLLPKYKRDVTEVVTI